MQLAEQSDKPVEDLVNDCLHVLDEDLYEDIIIIK